MSSYFDLIYVLLFLPLTILIYGVAQKKHKYIILLIASLLFFFIISKELIICLLLSVISIYLGGRSLTKLDAKIDKDYKKFKKEEKQEFKLISKRNKKIILIVTIIFNILILFIFKYLSSFLNNFNVLVPIGISFYTLQALSYIVDVYNGKIESENNILKLALLLSFFPKILAGPIINYEETAKKLYKGHKIKYKNLCYGYQRIILGFFKRIVIADRLKLLVLTVLNDYTSYSGITLWLTIILFTIMIYSELSGTLDVAIGSAEVFGIDLPENYLQPFFSKSILEFLERWNITVINWFKEYIYNPMMKLFANSKRKNIFINGLILLVCCLLYGIWYGFGVNFIIFGFYYFIIIVLGYFLEKYIIKICKKYKIDRSNKIYGICQSIKLAFIVSIGNIFILSSSIKIVFGILKKMFTNFELSSNQILAIGLDGQDFFILFLAIVFIFIISLLKENNIDIRKSIGKKPIYIRWTLYYLLILSIIIFGAYGIDYIPLVG